MPLAHDLEIGSELGHRLHFLLAYRWGLIIPATGYQEIKLLNHVLEVSGYSRYDSHGRNRLCRRTVNRNPTLQTVVTGSMGLKVNIKKSYNWAQSLWCLILGPSESENTSSVPGALFIFIPLRNQSNLNSPIQRRIKVITYELTGYNLRVYMKAN